LRLPDTDPVIEAAVDRALGEAELDVVPVELPGWLAAAEAVTAILASEAFAVNRELFAAHPEAVAEPAAGILGFGSTFTPEQVDAARVVQKAWRTSWPAFSSGWRPSSW